MLAKRAEWDCAHARGNPPELQKKLDTIHEKYQKFTIEKRKQAGGEVVGERASG